MTVSSLLGFSFLFFPTGKCDFVGLGVNCDYYHAGLGIKERKRVHQLFIRDEIQVIFASFFSFFFVNIQCTVVGFHANKRLCQSQIVSIRSSVMEHNMTSFFFCFNMQCTVVEYHMNNSFCQSLIFL